MDPILSFIYCISSLFNFLPLEAQPRCKIEVIAELSDSLKDVRIAKNDWKKLYDASV